MSHGQGDKGEELFLVPDVLDSYYLYAPLRRVVVSLNTGAVNSVSRFLRGGDSGLEPGDRQVIEYRQ